MRRSVQSPFKEDFQLVSYMRCFDTRCFVVFAAASRGMLRSVGYARCSVRRLSTRPHSAFLGTRELSCLARKAASPGIGRQKIRVGRPAAQRFDRRAFSHETWVLPFAKPSAAGTSILPSDVYMI